MRKEQRFGQLGRWSFSKGIEFLLKAINKLQIIHYSTVRNKRICEMSTVDRNHTF